MFRVHGLSVVFGLLACSVFFAGCGPNAESVDDAQNRIQELKDKGVPDSELSSAKVLLSQVEGAIRSGSTQNAGRLYDSAIVMISEAESLYAKRMEELAPRLKTMRAEIEEKAASLEGLHKEPVNQYFTSIDTLMEKQWLLQAHQQMQKLDSLVPSLLAQQEQAEELRPKARGVWARTDRDGNAVRKEKFIMNKDGTLTTTESKKGQSSEYLKEDWAFTSFGTWQLKGDTVYFLIEREKCNKQTFWNKKNGSWVKSTQPTYDSTITDGSKDRFVSWEYLKTNYRKR